MTMRIVGPDVIQLSHKSCSVIYLPDEGLPCDITSGTNGRATYLLEQLLDLPGTNVLIKLPRVLWVEFGCVSWIYTKAESS